MALEIELADVGALIRTRTKTTAEDPETPEEYVGTFTEYTRPTDEQVEALIVQGIRAVTGRVGSIPELDEDAEDTLPDWVDTAKLCAALFTAMLVEQSFFSEQIEQGQSPYDRLRDMWNAEIEQLTAAMSGGSQSRGLVSATFVSPFSGDDDEDDLELPL